MLYAIMKELASDVRCNRYACDDHDIERAAYTAGQFKAYCNMLGLLGNRVEAGTYDDNGCSRISYLMFNGEVLLKNSDWKEAFWNMMEGSVESNEQQGAGGQACGAEYDVTRGIPETA